MFELQSTEQQLVEIARAEALLQHRDPEQAAQIARAQILHRDTDADRRQRASVIDSAAAANAGRRRRRRVVLGVAAVIVVAAAVPASRLWLREKDRESRQRAQLSSLGKTAGPLGFREADQWLDVPPAGVTFQVPRNTCSALVAAREGEAAVTGLALERPGAAKVTASGGVVWCSCEPEKVTVTLPDGRGARVALGWLSAPTPATGGTEVLAASPPAGFQVVENLAALGCADAGFQGWAEKDGHGDLDPLPATRPGPTADLVAGGFEPVGLFPGERAFAVVRGKQGRCYLAVPERGPGQLALRGPDGARLIEGAGGALVWCSHAADAVLSLWRADRGPGAPVAVLGAPADRAGATLGATLALRRHGIRDVQTALLPGELAADARAALIGSSVPAPSIAEADASGLPGKPGDRVVAFSLRGKLGMLAEVSPVVPSVCLPEADGGPPPLALLCVQARGQAWHRTADVQQQGAVEGVLPYWLAVLDGAGDEGALRAAAGILLFAERLSLLGFEPTTTDGVKDTPAGAVVSALGPKGAVVAVGLSKGQPWVSPLTDGPAWTLPGAPRVIQIPAGTTRVLRSPAFLAAPARERRVVVWRR